MWTNSEIKNFKTYLEDPIVFGKKVKVRKSQYCVYSGELIRRGQEAYFVKVYPNTVEGSCLELDKPMRFYACYKCPECFH